MIHDVLPRRHTPAVAPRLAFTLAELLVVIAIILILVGIFVPYAMKVRESDRRVRCAENLRAIHAALGAYADQNRHDYPRVRYDPHRPGYTAYTGADAVSPFAPGTTVEPNDVTASLWLVVRGGWIDPKRFICPSASESPDPLLSGDQSVPAARRSNFTGPRYLSYSYSSPFSPAAKYRLNSDVLPADFALVADMNPGIGGGSDVTQPAFSASPMDLAVANSRNHNRAGQNVLYADGHVQFQKTPYCGVGHEWNRDNIFTAFSRSPLPAVPVSPDAHGFFGRELGPAWEQDCYLVPAERN